MSLSMIVAVLPNGVIGSNGGLPWPPRSYPDDMRHFVETTMGHPVVMGVKTWNSLPKKSRPLEGRANYVLSRSTPAGQSDKFPGAFVLNGIEPVLAMAKEEKIICMGGGELYAILLPFADEIFLTRIRTTDPNTVSDPTTCVFFPDLDKEEWEIDHQWPTQHYDGGPGMDNKHPLSIFRYVPRK